MTTKTIRIFLLVLVIGSGSQSAAFDSWFLSKYNIHQIAVLGLSCLILHTAAQNTTDTTTLLATNSFIYFSTWLGNAMAFTDVFGWGLDWLAGFIFYKKGDSLAVTLLKEQIKDLSQHENLTHRDILEDTKEIIDIYIAFIEKNGAASPEAKRKILQSLDSAIEILEKSEKEEIAINIEPMPSGQE